MVCCAALGFVLLFLPYPALGFEEKQLLKIINHLQLISKPTNQYAMGINVPAKYCDKDGNLDQNFLSLDKAENVRKNMNQHEDPVYRGHQLIGAKPKKAPGNKYNFHSEYLLLINSRPEKSDQEDNLMKNLLAKDANGCTVFFTVNSPCVRTCSTPKDQNHPYSIIPALEMFSNHNRSKAFVFRNIWQHDKETKKWGENIKTIHKKIPVYRCFENECVKCVNEIEEVDPRCVDHKTPLAEIFKL